MRYAPRAGGKNMIKSYLKLNFRNLLKNRVYATITITGLEIALASCFLIYLYVLGELSFDRYHQNADRIYRVVYGAEKMITATPFILAPNLQNDFPEVVKAVRVTSKMSVQIQKDGNWISETEFIGADKAFFEVFTLPLIQGAPETVLNEPFSVVITKSMAQKYFGNELALNKTLNIQIENEKYDLKVTGILDHFPQNSHFIAEFIASISLVEKVYAQMEKRMQAQFGFPISLLNSWDGSSFSTYLLLPESYPKTKLDQKLVEFEKKHFAGNLKFNLKLQPLTDIHLHSPDQGKMSNLYLFSAIAILILVVAVVNFVILSTAQSFTRLREMGLRKVLGAARADLIKQILSEAFLTTIIALFLAMILVELFRPFINQLFGTEMSANYLQNWQFMAGSLLIVGIVTISSGSFIAYYVSAFQPAEVLKSKPLKNTSKSYFKEGLIVAELLIFISMLTCSLLFYRQIYFLNNKDLGFNPQNLIGFDFPTPEFKQNFMAFKEEIRQNPGVLFSGAAFDVPPSESGFQVEINPTDNNESKKTMKALFVDYDYLETIEARLIAGRFYSDKLASDPQESIILNESAVKALNIPPPYPEKSINCLGNNRKIIGVIQDYHEESLHAQINPMLFCLGPEQNRQAVIRLDAQNMPGTIEVIRTIFKKFAPNATFSYHFVADDYKKFYHAEEKLGRIIATFTLLTILLTCLGLFGLSLFMTERRTKEIGIRKVLGASVAEIVLLLTKDFNRLIILSCFIAWPITWLIINKWLQNFAYRIEIGWWTFALSGILALIIAFISISWQTIRAAMGNPVVSLRYE